MSDLENITKSSIVADIGQSGNVFSPYFDNLIEPCMKGKYTEYQEHPKGEPIYLNRK